MACILFIFLIIWGIAWGCGLIERSCLCLIIIFLFIGNYTTLHALAPTPMYTALMDGALSDGCTVTGVVERVEQRENGVRLTVKNVDFYGEREKRILVTADYFDGTQGDTVRITGKVLEFQQSRNHGEFDSNWYYKTKGIWVKMSGEVSVVSKGPFYYRLLSDFRAGFSKALDAIARDNTAGTFKSVILGDKSELDEAVRASFQENGISHILAISGLHLSIIGLTLYKLLRKSGLSFWICAGVSITVLTGYGILTGNSISTVRSLVMYIISVNAQVTGRRYDVITAASLAALLLLIQNPLYVAASGFLLSFGAVVGIVIVGKRLGDMLPDSVPRFLRKPLLALLGSFGVSLVTVPVLGWFYYEISTYSVLLNIIVIPLMTFVMAGGIIGGLAAMINPAAGCLAVGLAYYILKFYEILCDFVSRLPHHLIVTGCPRAEMTVIYGILIIVLCVIGGKAKKAYRNLVTAVAVGTVSMLVLFNVQKNNLAIHMLDVGQGQCILVENHGKYILVDCGSSDVKGCAGRRVIPCLKYYGISQLDAVFVTHFDSDHYNGVADIIDDGTIEIKRIYYGGIEEGMPEVIESKIPGSKLYSGAVLSWDGAAIKVYNPDMNYLYQDENAASLVFSLEKDGFCVLFTGDLDGKIEEKVTEEIKRMGTPGFTLLQVAHHGSKNSSTAQFLEYIHPRMSMISCGARNFYGHPNPETLDRLAAVDADIYDTAHCGEITVMPFAKERTVSCFFQQ